MQVRARPMPPSDSEVSALFAQALACHRQGRLDAAAKSYREVARLRPGFADAHYNLGIVRKQQGKPGAAVAAFRQALRHRLEYVEALNNLATTLRDQGEAAQAEPPLRHALALRPQAPELHNNLGLVLRDLGQGAAALAAFTTALALNPAFTEARRNLAGTHAAAGQHAEAAACLRVLVTQQPEDVMAQGWRSGLAARGSADPGGAHRRGRPAGGRGERAGARAGRLARAARPPFLCLLNEWGLGTCPQRSPEAEPLAFLTQPPPEWSKPSGCRKHPAAAPRR